MKDKRLILVTGPTASGKTSLAIELALHFNTSIISADSRQCFRELNIGVAKPSDAQLAAVSHYFINSHSIFDDVNAATFAAYAEEVLKELFKQHDLVVMAGGTGLYIKAFEEGLDEIPAIPPETRNSVITGYEAQGIAWLQEQLRRHDPEYYQTGEMQNPQRMMRALEVKLATGKSIKSFHKSAKNNIAHRGYSFSKFAIDLPREQLYRNIDTRVDEMMLAGLEQEARSLLPYRRLNALQTVGYAELFEYFDGHISLRDAVEKIKQHTRNYAKRQLTWFRKDEQIIWVTRLNELLHHVDAHP